MSIDMKDWQAQLERTFSDRQAPQVEYRTISQDAAWEQLKTWLRTEIEAKTQEVEGHANRLMMSRDYSHQGLITQKTLVDIAQAQVLILSKIEEKVLAYTKE